MAVKSIPAGMHTVVPHLTVADGKKAIAFYEKVLGAETQTKLFAPDGKLMHAALRVGDAHVYLSDMMMGTQPAPSGVAVHLWSENPDAIFDRAVKAGATVRHPLSDMFWGDRYGQFVDPFGHTWAVSKHLEDLTPEQTQERAAEFFQKMAAGNCAG